MSNLEIILNHFGSKAQVIKAIEELSELQKVLCKELNGSFTKHNLYEEMADVEIMLEQLKIIYDVDSYILDQYKATKVQRTLKRISEEQNG